MSETPDWLDDARGIQALVQLDECRIDRLSSYYDRELEEDVETVVEVYAGPCRFPRADAAVRVIVTGESITPAMPTVKVPWDTVGVEADDRVTCTASLTPANVGRVVWVTDASPRTFQSAVNLTCREIR